MAQALDYYLKAETYYLYFDKQANAEARRLYGQAVDEERKKEKPEFARPFSDLAYSILHAWLFNWDPDASLDEAHGLAMEAIEIADNDYYTRWIMAAILLYQRQFDASESGYDEAMSLAADQAIPEEQRALRAEALRLWGDHVQGSCGVADGAVAGPSGAAEPCGAGCVSPSNARSR